ncbi:MAG: DUF4198 domain-containing protein [Stagnimonas sp.]|nr:DUF4198 domain-containing protein [Stagnimonas sp.]
MRLPHRTLSLLLLAVAAPLSAHDTWLLADPAGVAGIPRQLALSSGMAFPKPEYAPLPERVERAWGGRAGAWQALPPPKRGAHALVFRPPAVAGPAAYAVLTLPKQLDMDLAEVEHYFDEIHAGPALRQHWQQQPEPRRWREQYRKHSKALVTVAGQCPELGEQALGLGLELLLEGDICALRPGEPLRVRALQGGVAKAGLSLALVGAGGREQANVSTDAEGRAQFRLPAAGAWLLRATDLRPATVPGLDWQSDFTTLTFRVH